MVNNTRLLIIAAILGLCAWDVYAQQVPAPLDGELVPCAASPCRLTWLFPPLRIDDTTTMTPADFIHTDIRWGHCPYTFQGEWHEPGLHNRHPLVTAPATETTIAFPAGTVWCVELFVLARDGLPSGRIYRRVHIPLSQPAGRLPGRPTMPPTP